MQDFSFFLPFEKAEQAEDGKWTLRGVISTTSKDLDGDVITKNGLQSMVDQCNSGDIPIVTSHQHEIGDEVGVITKAHLDDTGTACVIEATLDDDPIAERVAKKIAKAKRAGFSIGGGARKFTKALGGRMLIDDVALKHVMVTSRPKNNDTFAVALHKSIEEEMEKAVNPSDEQRETHATYFEADESGKKVGKFPIWNADSAESALHLIGKAPADKQAAIREKACSFLKDHPACKELSKTMNDCKCNKLEKAGAKFSADSISKLKDIHDSGDDVVKSKVKDLLGDDFPSDDGAAGVITDQNSDIGEVKNDSGNDGIGMGPDGSLEKNPADISKAMTELKEFIKTEIAAIKTIEPKGSSVIEKSDAPNKAVEDYMSAKLERLQSPASFPAV